ncbi:MAG: transglutaminase domain-containing protein [Candidatus Hydrogenedentes bacterium]|nr:transglutaminase domain-containing protein [Candidatus Hydrogenedentota bacterium]
MRIRFDPVLSLAFVVAFAALPGCQSLPKSGTAFPSTPVSLPAVSDPATPAPESYLAPAQDEDTALLDDTLKQIFGDLTPAVDEASALKIMAFIAQAYGSAPPSTYNKSGTAVLRGGPDNLCGDKATLMTALCRRIHMPARTLVFYNFEALDAHIAVEAHFDGAWHYLDPTLGLFPYSRPKYNGKGYIPSRVELLATPALRDYLFFIGAERLWSKNPQPVSEFEALPTGFKKEDWQRFSFHEICQSLFSQAFPVQRDKDDEVSYPLQLDLEGAGEAWIGAVNASPADCQPAMLDGQARRFSAIHFIGKGDMLNVFHTLMMDLDRPGAYRLTYHFIDTFPATELAFSALKDARVLAVRRLEKGWQCDFAALSDEPILLVRNLKAAAVLDAFQLQRLPQDGAVEAKREL